MYIHRDICNVLSSGYLINHILQSRGIWPIELGGSWKVTSDSCEQEQKSA